MICVWPLSNLTTFEPKLLFGLETVVFSIKIVDRDSYILIWELLILLMKQKNTLDGSDIAELLLQDRKDIHSSYSTVAAAKIKPIEKVI